MNKPVAMTLAVLLCSFIFTFSAGAVDAPHYAPAAGNVCGTCHTVQLTLGSTGYNNICQNCHRPGDPAAGAKPITLADAANPFGNHSTTGITRMYQTSHRWDGSDTNPAAGAQPPVQSQMTTNNLRGRTNGQLACVRCHNQHSNANGSFLRMANDQDQLCLDCHRSRNVQSHTQGSHPVGVPFSGTKAGFKAIPINSANPTADLNIYLKNGNVSCSTCHGVHFTDSRSSTVDGSSHFANLSSGDGYILRTDRRGTSAGAGFDSSANICTTCHAGKASHNMKGQDIQCVDCHGAHVEYDPTDPTGSKGTNIHLVRRAVDKRTTGSGQIFFRYTASQREYKNAGNTGVCQGCHAVPAPGGIYPSEHASSDPIVCNTCHYHNSSNGSFSGACSACHGYPPTTATLGGPTGVAVPATGATPTSPGAHVTHAKTHFMACNTCHTGYATKTMPSSSIDIGFAINGSNFPGFGGTVSGGTFNSTPLNSGYSWSASNGTTLTTGNSAITCSVYCHGTTLTGGSATPPTWTKTDGTQKTCGACHGVTSATAPTSGSHLRHAGNGSGGLAVLCATCHGAHLNNDHVNGSVEWDLSGLNGGGRYKNAQSGSTGAIAPSVSYGQCTNLYCHSNGTSLLAPTAPRTIPTWGGATLGCDACHDGTSTGPSYPNGAPKANSHAIHVVTNGYGCNACHYDTTTSGTTITTPVNHVNGAFNLAPNTVAGVNYTPTIGTPSTPSSCANITCHGGNSATWGATLGCQGCHSGATDKDVFTTPFSSASQVAAINTTEWTTSGHGRATGTGNYTSGNPAANFTGTNQCLYCHDTSIGHNAASNPFRMRNFNDASWGKNGVCMVCHAAGAAGVTIDGVTRTATKKISSTHNGYGHTTSDAGQFCWDCHDAHGDANIYMIHDNVYATSDVATGVPSGSLKAVSFIAAITGTDYAKSTGQFTGICNVCHTSTSHYTSTSGDNHNSTIRCTSCHVHNGVDANSAFAPSGSSCDGCHGYPPASASFAGTQNNWSSARSENYPGGGGAHTINNHVSKLAKPGEGFANCSKCHDSADHKMSPIVFNPSQNIKVSVNQSFRMESAKQAKYSSNRLDASLHQTGTCSNISCHFGATPKWDPAQ
jgi:predicted CxxxxCH...CXXCH cytochrome family protein